MQWITALQLQQWADTLAARASFPALVSDLVRASSTEISNIRFPSGDKGQVRGFDGNLTAVGVPPYVPDGNSIWEFGVAIGAENKANSDYEKRTLEVAEEIRRETTFVFASPRTWDKPKEKIADWVQQKRALNQWKNVEYLDGVTIADWLMDQPAVAARYARYELKLAPAHGARSTDEFWEDYANRFAPALVEDVLLAGRPQQAELLLKQLGDGASKLRFAADSPDEVIAFAVAAIRRAEPSLRFFLEAKTLVVDTESAATQLAVKRGLNFLPRAEAKASAGLLAQYGPTIMSAGADDRRKDFEQLPRPTSATLGKAFSAMGYNEQQGYELARKCGRSLAVLARQIPSGTAPKPEWIGNENELLPALLVGAWNATSEPDQAILCALTPCAQYATFEAPLRKLAKLKDPPLDRVGGIWATRASIDAFLHVGHLIGPEHLSRFSAVAIAVFSQVNAEPQPDDVFRLPTEQPDAHSQWLREGMMTTLLHMAALHEEAGFEVPGSSPQEYVDGVINSLPGLSTDYRLMASLQDNLALLAEAAPIPFLSALERLLEGDVANIIPIFDEQKGLITNQSFHLGVLWALEALAWEPDLLLRSALCLARLAAIDPGGTLSNRPINSLREIFLTWSPSTRATTRERLGVLRAVVQTVPSISWQLLSKLLPTRMDSSNSTQKLRFRESSEVVPEVMTYGLVWTSQSFVVELALKEAGVDVERWKKLIKGLNQFPQESQTKTIDAVEQVLISLEVGKRFAIWDELRKEVNRHKAFADKSWALKEDVLERLDALVQAHQPQDPLLVHTWLFDDWLPSVAGKYSTSGDPTAEIESARFDALQKVLDANGIEGLAKLAKRVKLSHQLAVALTALKLDEAQLLGLLNLCIDAEDSLLDISAIIVNDGYSRFGDHWLEELRRVIEGRGMALPRAAHLFMGMRESKATWDIVSLFGEQISNQYWKQKNASHVHGDANDLLVAIEAYIASGRALGAIQVSISRLGDVPTSKLMALLNSAIPEINSQEGGDSTMTVYYVEQVFAELEKRSDLSAQELARMEFKYLPCFSHREAPLTLHRLMTQDAETYMSVICAVYKSDKDEQEEVSADVKRLALASYELLLSLSILPGQTENEIDVDVLQKWCDDVRALAVARDRGPITDSRIGALLAHSLPSIADNAWPHESVRSVIENVASDPLESGLMTERFNMRGVVTRAVGEGGRQERELAKEVKGWAAAMPDYPRTAAMLVRISNAWNEDADRVDVQAARDALLR